MEQNNNRRAEDAERPKLPLTWEESGEWQIVGSLVYRLGADGANCDEINVTMANGSRGEMRRNIAAMHVFNFLSAPAAPAVDAAKLDESEPNVSYVRELVQSDELKKLVAEWAHCSIMAKDKAWAEVLRYTREVTHRQHVSSYNAGLAAARALPVDAAKLDDLGKLTRYDPELITAQWDQYEVGMDSSTVGDYVKFDDVAALVAQQAARIAAHPEAQWQALCVRAVAVLNRHIVPDGISDRDALTELYGIFDGPEYRAIADIAQDRCDADQARAMQMDKQVKMMTATSEGK